MTDFKKLIYPLKNSPNLNKILDCFLDSFSQIDKFVEESFSYLNIDKCEGKWLDNLGLLIGVKRPVIQSSLQWLFTDSFNNSSDFSNYYVSGAPNNPVLMLADDNYYRILIRSQIFRNNLTVYSYNALEQIVMSLFNFDPFEVFSIEMTDFNSGSAEVYIDDKFSPISIAFLQNYQFDQKGRKKFDFPYPPQIKTIHITQV